MIRRVEKVAKHVVTIDTRLLYRTKRRLTFVLKKLRGENNNNCVSIVLLLRYVFEYWVNYLLGNKLLIILNSINNTSSIAYFIEAFFHVFDSCASVYLVTARNTIHVDFGFVLLFVVFVVSDAKLFNVLQNGIQFLLKKKNI